LLKHASNVPQTALFMQDLFARAGFPAGTFQTLLVGSGRVEAILRDRRVMAATLTGSTPAGASVAAIAGSEIKKVVLELGGSDPFVVMPSADLPRAAEVAAFARLLNNGQSCIAAKRFIVHDAVYDEFERLFTAQMAAKSVGDPMLDGTDIGPLASEQQRDDVEHLVADAVAKGARALCGGAAPEGSGFYYPPTVLAGITPEMRVHTEEVFGPVATLYRVPDIDAALDLARHRRLVRVDVDIDQRRPVEAQRLLDRSGQVVRLPDLDAVGAVGRGDRRVVDVRAGVAHPVLGVAEDHLLPQDLAERVVV